MSEESVQNSSLAESSLKENVTIKLIGIGDAGCNAVDYLHRMALPGLHCVALNTNAQALAQAGAAEKYLLGGNRTRGLGTGGDPDLGQALAEAEGEGLRALCSGADIVFLAAGLGGGTGSGVSPVLARLAKETGALVLGFAITPFPFEGTRRQHQAQLGMDHLKEAADGVISVPNQRVLKLINEQTSVLETFTLTNELLAQGVRGIWRLIHQSGLIHVDFADLCAVLRGRHSVSSFAAVESHGPQRSRQVVEKLLASPLLDQGLALSEADALLISIVGGRDLTMNEVNRVMDQVQRQCEQPHLIMGATIDEDFNERLEVTVVISHRVRTGQSASGQDEPSSESYPSDTQHWHAQLLNDAVTSRPTSRFVAPPPELTQERAEHLIQQQGAPRLKRRNLNRWRQGQLPLEIISRGRFEKSEPTIHEGEDLDVPTYIRRGVALN